MKANQAHVDRVWDVIEKVGICMMTTRFEGACAPPEVLAKNFSLPASTFVNFPMPESVFAKFPKAR